ncbi:uncharacterized protein LOC126235962 [Schistocerca nitens]|uniref:uncharacterized protein LOC126235962 n=1 Tax=Schistocerca nitens TaxID=7011 RepID=UPI0021187AC4|nr:uncharacterized protein LOC126235962 [Schistocerca nitens]
MVNSVCKARRQRSDYMAVIKSGGAASKPDARKRRAANHSWSPRTAWPQQLPERAITIQRDDSTETEPAPPLVLPMELDLPIMQQLMPSTSGYWPPAVDAYNPGCFLGDVSTTAKAGWWGTTGSLTSPAATASGPLQC